ncbi:siderophore-interacting protein [Kitasatospora sp. NPDC050543]|uniref:siderophore-interacting protein n=1 Tax=Kitasatospora sp. NPDC050543 TaxID=3364054 RepID=UPI0037937DB5
MTTESAAIAVQFRFFDAQVVRSRRLGPTMVRVTLGGEQLRAFASGGRDQSFSLFLPHPGQDAPVLPVEAGEGWFHEWRALPEDVRAVMRSYTIREQRTDTAGGTELDVDFALHGDLGPASRWAATAGPGERVILLGPAVADNRSVGFRPPDGTDWMLIAGDETALPAIGGILDQLPAGARARVWIEVPHAEDIQDLPCAGEVAATWLVREHAGTAPLLNAVRAAELPQGTPYAWIAGESGAVKALRRHLVGERGFDRRSVTFSGYWRLGASEEDLRAEAISAAESGASADAGPDAE